MPPKDLNSENRKPLIASHDLETLKFALEAYNTANTHAMQLWYAAALVSIPIMIQAAGFGEVQAVLDLHLSTTTVLPALLATLSALNLIFVIAQVSHHRMANIYRSIVKTLFADEKMVSADFTWTDLAMRAPIAGYNRIMPLLEGFGMRRGAFSTCLVRMGFNLLFGLSPLGVLLLGLVELPSTAPFYIAVNVAGAISFVGSIAIMQHAYWGFRECRNESESKTVSGV